MAFIAIIGPSVRPLFCGFLQRPPLGIMFSRLYVGANSGFITVRGSCYDKGDHRPFCLGLLLRAASRTSLGDYAFAFIRALVNVSKILLYCFLRDVRLSLCFYCSGVYRDHRPFCAAFVFGVSSMAPLRDYVFTLMRGRELRFHYRARIVLP